jgi:hypothetical protein
VTALKIYLSGEGRNELGFRVRHEVYQQPEDGPGVVEALLFAVALTEFEIVGAMQWNKIVKYEAYKGPRPARNEARTVLGLALDARRAGADVLAFLRDQDGHPERTSIIQDAIATAESQFAPLKVVGHTPVQVLEAWMLALLGEHGSEAWSRTKAQKLLAQRGKSTTAEMVEIVQGALPSCELPADAKSLRLWLDRAKKVLGQH